MRKLAVLLLISSPAWAQTNIGEVSIDQTGSHNDVDAVCSGTVTANAGSGTFFDGIVKDGTGDTTQANVASGRLATDASVSVFPDNEPFNLGQVGGTSTVTGGVNGSLGVGGNVAHGASTASNPITVGVRARSYGSAVTAEAASDVVDLSADRQGILFVLPFHPNATVVEYMWTTAQTNDPLVSVSSGTRIVVTGYQVTFDEAGTTGVSIRCGFATSTLSTAPTDGNTATGVFLHHNGTIPGTGINSPPGMAVAGADDEDLRCTTEATTSGTGKMVVFYFTTAN